MKSRAVTSARNPQRALVLIGGFHPGPLFEIRKRRMPKRYGTVMQGRLRRASEARATPPWADKAAIRAIYRERDRLNAIAGSIEYHVDHVIPLLSPWVCGLHVESNLEVMPWRENAGKGNHTWPGQPHEQMRLL